MVKLAICNVELFASVADGNTGASGGADVGVTVVGVTVVPGVAGVSASAVPDVGISADIATPVLEADRFGVDEIGNCGDVDKFAVAVSSVDVGCSAVVSGTTPGRFSNSCGAEFTMLSYSNMVTLSVSLSS